MHFKILRVFKPNKFGCFFSGSISLFKKIIVLSFLIFTFTLIAEDKEIRIFFTGNVQGNSLSFSNSHGENQGGAAARKTLFDSFVDRKSRGNTLLIDAGGFMKGTEMSIFTNGASDVAGMNALGYDLAAVSLSEIADSVRIFNANKKAASFYFLASNLTISGKDAGIPYFLQTVNGVRVLILSFIDRNSYLAMSSDSRGGFSIEDPFTKASEVAASYREESNADVVIALTSIGYIPGERDFGALRLLNNYPIDIIIESGSGLKDYTLHREGNKGIIIPGEKGLFLGELNITAGGNKISDFNVNFHAVNAKRNGEFIGEEIAEDKKVLGRFTRFIRAAANTKKKMSAELKSGVLTTEGRMNKAASMTALFTDALRIRTESDLAFINSGFFADAKLEEGSKIDYNTFDPMFRFENSAVVMSINGRELRELFNYSFKRIGFGNFLQFSGAVVEYDRQKKEILSIKIGGRDIINDKLYKVAVTDYLSRGGDGYYQFVSNRTKVFTNIPLNFIVNSYISEISYVNAVEPSVLIFK